MKRPQNPSLLRAIATAVLALAMAGCTALGISPKPTAALIRLGFDKGGVAMSQALEKHVPAGVAATLDARYDASDDDALLDVFYPARIENTATVLPTIVWVHGAGLSAGERETAACGPHAALPRGGFGRCADRGPVGQHHQRALVCPGGRYRAGRVPLSIARRSVVLRRDPLAPQSHAMAEALAAQKVPVDSLFFPTTYAPALPHEYQFNLDTAAGQQALERSVRFLSSRK